MTPLTPEQLQSYLPQGEAARHTPLAQLRDVAWQQAELILPTATGSLTPQWSGSHGLLTIPAGAEVTLRLDWTLPGAGRFTARTLSLALEADAHLTLLEAYSGSGGWAADTLTVTLAQGAHLTHGLVSTVGGHLFRDDVLTLAPRATCRRDAFQTGSPLSRLAVSLTAQGQNTVTIRGTDISAPNQHHQSTHFASFVGPNSTADVQQRNISATGAHTNFQGKYLVQKPAQKTDAAMRVDNLLLGNKALAFGKPELEIYADDVRCTHGATTGGLNPDQLFYLYSRGLTPTQARQLLVEGFASQLLHPAPDAFKSEAFPAVQNALKILTA